MIRLHGGYLAFTPGFPLRGFFVWAEGAYNALAEKNRHPRALSHADIDAFLLSETREVFPRVFLDRCQRGRIQITVPAFRGRPVPSIPALRDSEDYVPPGKAVLRPFELDVLFLPAPRVLETLLYLADVLPPTRSGVGPADDLEYWIETARWAFDLLLRRRVAPVIENGWARWHPVLSDHFEKGRLDLFASACPPVARTAAPVGMRHPAELFPAPKALLTAFLDEMVDGTARELLQEVVPAERLKGVKEPEALFVAHLALPYGASGGEEEIPPALIERVSSWTTSLLAPHADESLRLGVRLLPPDQSPPEAEAAWRISFHLEATNDPSLQLFAGEIWSSIESTVKRLGRRFKNPEETLLAELGAAAAVSSCISKSLEDRHPEGLPLTTAEAYRFLTQEAPLLGDMGVRLYLPGEGRPQKASLRLKARQSSWRSGSAVTRFGLSTLVDFDWKVAIGNALLTPEEFEELAARKIPFVEVRGQWILLDPENVGRVMQFLDRRSSHHTTLGDVLRLAGGLGMPPDEADLVESITGEGWIGEFLDPQTARENLVSFESPKDLAGTLRPYQLRGVAWLRFLLSRGLGGCLADDMGLGKTIQFLATLLVARAAGESIRPSLLICPTSVAENWLKESQRFAPSLCVTIHHGPERAAGEEFETLVANHDLIVTTYPLAHRDRAILSNFEWEYLALDEAQNIKNPATAQAKAIRAFKARRRAALTGTPMENRLSELKAILDFLNGGLLGSEESFRKEFSIPIERHQLPEAAERLRRITAPFLLRRLKTDPLIEPDLPEKIETKEFVGLSREQASLYQATTRSLLEGIGGSKGAARKAKVLVLLLRLKQICNHPALFLADGSRIEGRSAKLERLMQILEETFAEKRPALLFTQFTEMGNILVQALKSRFGGEVLFLHGSVNRTARHEMVRRFQEDDDPPLFFVLSLKAGGSGLNLTRASHVFHVDRWWNPAVEDQATDRVFRIGQTRHVQVHKFVCRGTLEERIDAMIDEKKSLAQSIVSAGETWLTELSDKELESLVTLRREALLDIEDGR